MPEITEPERRPVEPDRLMRGLLTKVGDTFDQLTGRKWMPSSSIATSELIERIKGLLDSEARDIPGKGKVVPHFLTLKVQWDKFDTDNDAALTALENELLIATIDHINDSVYYTYAPVRLTVKPDYFIQGVKLLAAFDEGDTSEENEKEVNVTVLGINISGVLNAVDTETQSALVQKCIAKFQINDVEKVIALTFPPDGRLSIGRTAESKLQIDDTSISKHHAVLATNEHGHLSIADTGSTNGTFLNDERIAYGKAIDITADDVIKFGSIEVRFSPVDEEPEPVEADPVAEESE